MKPHVLLRQIHHWLSPVVAAPLVVMIGAGVLLMLKKDVDWIQPPSRSGEVRDATPTATFAELLAAARSVPEAGIDSWTDLDRVDVKPDKGMVKFVSASRWEVQVDANTAEVLQVAYRRSDMIEAIHDGSFFADWVKYYVFLPAGVFLFVLWMTGLYLFCVPHLKRWKRDRAGRSRRARGEATRGRPTEARISPNRATRSEGQGELSEP